MAVFHGGSDGRFQPGSKEDCRNGEEVGNGLWWQQWRWMLRMTETAAVAMVMVLIGSSCIGKTINKEDSRNGMMAGKKQCQEWDGGW